MQIDNELKIDNFPEYFKNLSTCVKPSITILNSKIQKGNDSSNPNLVIICMWYNNLKIVEIQYA
jgi:hypothetical protein